MFPIYDHFSRQGVVHQEHPHPSWFSYPLEGYEVPRARGTFTSTSYYGHISFLGYVEGPNGHGGQPEEGTDEDGADHQ